MILWTDPIIFVQPFSGDNKDYVTYDGEKLSIRIREGIDLIDEEVIKEEQEIKKKKKIINQEKNNGEKYIKIEGDMVIIKDRVHRELDGIKWIPRRFCTIAALSRIVLF